MRKSNLSGAWLAMTEHCLCKSARASLNPYLNITCSVRAAALNEEALLKSTRSTKLRLYLLKSFQRYMAEYSLLWRKARQKAYIKRSSWNNWDQRTTRKTVVS